MISKVDRWAWDSVGQRSEQSSPAQIWSKWAQTNVSGCTPKYDKAKRGGTFDCVRSVTDLLRQHWGMIRSKWIVKKTKTGCFYLFIRMRQKIPSECIGSKDKRGFSLICRLVAHKNALEITHLFLVRSIPNLPKSLLAKRAHRLQMQWELFTFVVYREEKERDRCDANDCRRWEKSPLTFLAISISLSSSELLIVNVGWYRVHWFLQHSELSEMEQHERCSVSSSLS